jgi:alpha-D-ribose 1-methylphosphonate 5-triphosphate diphosphatase
LVTDNPAAAVGLVDRGRIEVGRRGDVVLVEVQDSIPTVRGVWSSGTRVA